jgi:hypothetical protein
MKKTRSLARRRRRRRFQYQQQQQLPMMMMMMMMLTMMLVMLLTMMSASAEATEGEEEEEHADEEDHDQHPYYALLLPWFSVAVGIIVFYVQTRHFHLFPYTCVMFLMGLFMGVGAVRSGLDDQLTISIAQWTNIHHETLFVVFLPGLLMKDALEVLTIRWWRSIKRKKFASPPCAGGVKCAYFFALSRTLLLKSIASSSGLFVLLCFLYIQLNFHLFVASFWQVMILAFPVVLAGTVLTALVTYYIFPYDWSWFLSLTVGCILSATDPVGTYCIVLCCLSTVLALNFFSISHSKTAKKKTRSQLFSYLHCFFVVGSSNHSRQCLAQ